MSAVPITAPSHSTIMTGRYPIAHGVRDNGLFVLGEEQLTLAEILRGEGYSTAAAVGAFPLTARFGLNQGFDFFDDHLTGGSEDYLGRRVVAKERLFFDERRASQVNDAVLPWLTEHAEDPFFLWLHYFDAHQPFEPPPPYDQLYADDPYSGEIAYADSRLGFMLDHLASLGALDRTLVIMTADHGEGLGEHHEITHAVLAYNSTLHVPLIIRPPGDTAPRGQVIEERVGTVDIVPTILDLLGLKAPPNLQGRSLVSLWNPTTSAPPPEAANYYAENLSPRLTHGWSELRVWFDGSSKYIHGPEPELYDLDADPQELNNLATSQPRESRRLRLALQRFLDAKAENTTVVTDLDDEVRKRLESLGYIHGSSADDLEITEKLQNGGVSPRDRVGDINDLSSAKHLLFDERTLEALVYTERLVTKDPNSPLYLELHASALLQADRLDEAAEVLARMERHGPVPEPLVLHTSARRFLGGDEEQRRGVVADLSHFVEASPSAAGAHLLAELHQSLGDIDRAQAEFERARAIDSSFLPSRIALAVLRAQSGDEWTAERELLEILDDAPYNAKAHYNYATMLLKSERFNAAADGFRRAIDLSPNYLKAQLGLVAALVAAGEQSAAQAANASLQGRAPQSNEARTARELLADP